MRLTRGNTGRSALVQDHGQATVYGRVQEFVRQICSAEDYSLKDPAAAAMADGLRSELALVASNGLQRRYFRGRPFAIGSAPLSTCFGPPPHGLQKEGRYNRGGGQSVLYLSRTLETCASECGVSAGEELFVQELQVSSPDLHWVYLAPDLEAQAPVLNSFLLLSELAPNDEAEHANFRHPYRATHFLVEVCEGIGISAIEYPSVRAGYPRSADAVNLVILPSAPAAVVNPVGSPQLHQRQG